MTLSGYFSWLTRMLLTDAVKVQKPHIASFLSGTVPGAIHKNGVERAGLLDAGSRFV